MKATRSTRRPLPLPLVSLAFATWLVASSAHAADFVVTSNGDQGDVIPGNGFCSTSTTFAVCTLRAAVEEANALPGNDRIIIGSRTVSLATQLHVTDDVTIEGDGPSSTVLQGLNSSRIINIEPAATVMLQDLKIEGARTSLSGAVRNVGVLTVRRVWFDDNQTTDCGGLLTTSNGSTAVHDSTFSNNHAGDGRDGGALCITQGGSTTINNTTLVGNSASRGGAIYLDGVASALVVYSSTLAGNVDTDPATSPPSSALFARLGSVQIFQSMVEGSCSYATVAQATNGVNLESPGDTCLLGGGEDYSNLSAEQLALGEVAYYGGPVPTMLPGTLSLAVDPIFDWPLCNPLDGRGEPRVNSCDVGAVERQPGDPEPGPIFVDGFESGNSKAWSSTSP